MEGFGETRLSVWRGDKRIGTLGDTPSGRFRFEYADGVVPGEEVSATMPVDEGPREADRLFPVFETGLPEGALAAELARMHGKDGFQGPLGLLAVTGANRIGDITFSTGDRPPGAAPETPGDLMAGVRGEGAAEAFARLVEARARWSGVSGVQPKALADDDERTVVEARWIVKRSTGDFPFLATNERFCLRAAELAGLEVPRVELSRDGEVLLVERFDRDAEGRAVAMEDFCGIMARQADSKYGVELRDMARAMETALPPSGRRAAAEAMFRMVTLNCMLRNGDGHARNFAILGRGREARLAPAYDICTTCVYKGFGADKMSVRIRGNDGWPDKRRLMEAATILGIEHGTAERLVEECRLGVLGAAAEMRAAMDDNPAFAPLGRMLLAAWDRGIRNTLSPGKRRESEWPPSGMGEAVFDFMDGVAGSGGRVLAQRDGPRAARPPGVTTWMG